MIEKQLAELNEDDFDVSEADEEQFISYMIKTFGEDQYRKGYAFVFNFRDKLHEPKTRKMVIK